MGLRQLSLAGLAAALAFCPADARCDPEAAPDPQDLTEISLADLANLKVTSVSKVPEEQFRATTAIYVITRDDIRRSAATTLPELLRLVPGVQVARADSDHWAVGIRGFGDQFSKSMLVLLDGRSVYTPLFAGVDWAIQDTLIQDIERIEVIRGPGGTVWGSNAVNGVINIITKSAAATHGTLVSTGGGTVDQALAAFRHGGSRGNVDYRFYGKVSSRGPEYHVADSNYDDWRSGQVGGRIDWSPRERDTLTLQTDVYKGHYGQRVGVGSFEPPAQVIFDQNVDQSGGNVLARWQRSFADGGNVQLQGSFHRTDASGPQFRESRDTFDIDFVHQVALSERNTIVWGAGARWSPGRFTQTIAGLDFTPRALTSSVYSGFLHDEFWVVPAKLSATVGCKVERNNYTGFEVQPNARVLWSPGRRHSAWLAVTRAVRIPSRLERDLRLTGFLAPDPLFYVQIDGNKDVQSETLVGYEAGYRALVGENLYVDLALFHNDYDDLINFGEGTFSVDPSPGPPHLTLHFPYANGVRGRTDGVEIAPEWRASRSWRLKASYSYLSFKLRNKPGNTDTGAVARFAGSSPKHAVVVQSSLMLPGGVEFDQTFRALTGLRNRDIKGYQTLDLRLARRFGASLSLSISGRDLLQPYHAEMSSDPGPTVQVRRSVYAQLEWTN